MGKKIIHYSTLPTAGAPYHIYKCLKKYTDLDVYLVQLHKKYSDGREFPGGLLLKTPEAEKLLKDAGNIVHLHNDWPIELSSYLGDKIVFSTLHSVPKKYCWKDLINWSKECFSIRQPMQMHEYKEYNVRSLPTLIDIYDMQPIDKPMDKIRINFAPTNKCAPPHPASKSYYQVQKVLEKIKNKYGDKVIIDFYKDKHHLDDLALKQQSHIVIDDITVHEMNGGHLPSQATFHLTGLFGLSYGCATINAVSYDDMNEYYNMGWGQDTPYNPFVEAQQGTLFETLCDLIDNPSKITESGSKGRLWMEKYYNPKKLAQEYVKIYTDLTEE